MEVGIKGTPNIAENLSPSTLARVQNRTNRARDVGLERLNSFAVLIPTTCRENCIMMSSRHVSMPIVEYFLFFFSLADCFDDNL